MRGSGVLAEVVQGLEMLINVLEYSLMQVEVSVGSYLSAKLMGYS